MAPDISSADQFEQALGHLVNAAIDGRIDPRGTWEIRNGNGVPDWEVQVVELEKTG